MPRDGKRGDPGVAEGEIANMQIFALKGNVPEISDVAPAVRDRARAVRVRLDAIRRQSPPPDDQLPAITDEQLERIRALSLVCGKVAHQGRRGRAASAVVDRVGGSP